MARWKYTLTDLVVGETTAALALLVFLPFVPAMQTGPMSPEAMSEAKGRDRSKVKMLGLATIMYANDYDDYMPTGNSTKAVALELRPYLSGEHPTKTNLEKAESYWQSENPAGSRILFNMKVTGKLSSEFLNPAEVLLVFAEKPWPDGDRAVAFCDGHGRLIGQDDFAKAMKTQLKRGSSYYQSPSHPTPKGPGR